MEGKGKKEEREEKGMERGRTEEKDKGRKTESAIA